MIIVPRPTFANRKSSGIKINIDEISVKMSQNEQVRTDRLTYDANKMLTSHDHDRSSVADWCVSALYFY